MHATYGDKRADTAFVGNRHVVNNTLKAIVLDGGCIEAVLRNRGLRIEDESSVLADSVAAGSLNGVNKNVARFCSQSVSQADPMSWFLELTVECNTQSPSIDVNAIL